jgi:hypothetical protein
MLGRLQQRDRFSNIGKQGDEEVSPRGEQSPFQYMCSFMAIAHRQGIIARRYTAPPPVLTSDLFPIDCTALPEQMLESDLSGTKKGPLPVRSSGKIGQIESATRDVFLDEVESWTLPIQKKQLLFYRT